VRVTEAVRVGGDIGWQEIWLVDESGQWWPVEWI
jgi:hypothetical protein